MSTTTCSWCGIRRKSSHEKVSQKLEWTFSRGTMVYADTFEEAVNVMKSTVGSSKFWASETTEGVWDVQLGENVIVHNVPAETVTEAVKKARWTVHLDSSFKKINSFH